MTTNCLTVLSAWLGMRAKLGIGILMAGVGSVEAAIYTVTSTNDNANGALRQAILDANANPGLDLINFAITNSTLSITPASPLPVITDPITLDGTTQPGFSSLPVVEINGVSAGAGADGLRLVTSNSLVRGLVINRFSGNGIALTNAATITIEGNILGLNAGGTTDQGNTLNGIYLPNSQNNVIGGSTPTTRNVLSGNNQNAIFIGGSSSFGNLVLGNYVGLSTRT